VRFGKKQNIALFNGKIKFSGLHLFMNVDFQWLILGNGRFDFVPFYELQRSIEVLHYGGATFHKITSIDV
jgi:hypothetical protein